MNNESSYDLCVNQKEIKKKREETFKRRKKQQKNVRD